jgi:hypothetical protein
MSIVRHLLEERSEVDLVEVDLGHRELKRGLGHRELKRGLGHRELKRSLGHRELKEVSWILRSEDGSRT